MSETTPKAKRHAPATARNREPILTVLRETIGDGPTRVLEIASGSGEHAVHFARALPNVVWQPTDVDADARASVDAYRAEESLSNLLPAVPFDAASAEAWTSLANDERARPDVVVCINMIHIAPWAACEGLVRGAARVLRPRGVLFLYGPFRFDGAFTAQSNADFDASLHARDPRWGVRDLEEVTALAAGAGLDRERVEPMPANNHSIVFRLRAP